MDKTIKSIYRVLLRNENRIEAKDIFVSKLGGMLFSKSRNSRNSMNREIDKYYTDLQKYLLK